MTERLGCLKTKDSETPLEISKDVEKIIEGLDYSKLNTHINGEKISISFGLKTYGTENIIGWIPFFGNQIKKAIKKSVRRELSFVKPYLSPEELAEIYDICFSAPSIEPLPFDYPFKEGEKRMFNDEKSRLYNGFKQQFGNRFDKNISNIIKE